MNTVFLGVLAYVALQFAIGLWASRRISTQSDYILAGRSLGPVVVSFSVFATWFGAEALVGTSGAVYESGLAGSIADPFGYAAGLIIAGVLVAIPLWRRKLTTFADLFRDRYSPGVERLVVVVLLPGSIFWAAAQVRAFGQIMGSTMGFSAEIAIAIAAVLVVAYTVVGGLLADAWTDFIQGVAVILGLIVLLVVVAGQVGGVGAGLANVEAERLAIFYLGEGGWLELAETLAVPICGTIVAVELISRLLGARSAGVAAGGAIAGGTMYLVFGLIPVFLGLAGTQLIPTLEDVEQIVPRLAEANLGQFLYVLFAGAVISAILSTVNSALLASAAQVWTNLIERAMPGLSESRKLLAIRLTLVALAVIAFALAVTAENVKDLVETASAAGSAGVFVTMLFALFTRFGGPLSAYGAIIVGAVLWLMGGLLEWQAPYVAALVAALATYVAGALIAPARGPSGD